MSYEEQTQPWILKYVLPPKEKTETTPRTELLESGFTWHRFNGAATNDYTAGLMEALGWTRTTTTRNGVVCLERPGKEEGSTSATVGAVAPGVVYCHTSSDPTFEEGTTYDAGDVYALLHHNGDRAAAEAALQPSVGGWRAFLSPEERAEGLKGLRAAGEATDAVQRLTEAVAKVVPDVIATPDSPKTPIEVLRASTFSEADLAAMPPPRWLVPGWIPEGGLFSIVGPSGSGKTFLALDLALTLATGHHSFGGIRLDNPKSLTVLYLIGEGATGYHQRIVAWRAHHGVTAPADIHYMPLAGVNLRDPEWHLAVLERALEVGADAVIVDTMAQFAGAMVENSNEDMMGFIEGMKLIRGGNNERLVGIIHHTGKDVSRGSRGHSSFYAALDVEITISHNPGANLTSQTLSKSKDSEMWLTLHWQRVIPEGTNSIVLEPVSNSDAIEAASDEYDRERDVLRLIRMVNDQENRGATRADIRGSLTFKSEAEYKKTMVTLRERKTIRREGSTKDSEYWVQDVEGFPEA